MMFSHYRTLTFSRSRPKVYFKTPLCEMTISHHNLQDGNNSKLLMSMLEIKFYQTIFSISGVN